MENTFIIISWGVISYIILIGLGLFFDELLERKRRKDYIEACGNTASLESWERYNKSVYTKTLIEKIFFPAFFIICVVPYAMCISFLWCISPPSRR